MTDKYAEIVKAMGAHTGRKEAAQRPLRHHELSDHASQRRRHHGRRSEDQRAQSLSAKLGRAEPVRDGRERVSAERRLQPDRNGRGARLLGGRRNPQPISQKSGTAGRCVDADRTSLLLRAAAAVATDRALVCAPTPTRKNSRRSSTAAIWRRLADCAACHTIRTAASRSQAGGRSKHRSAPSCRPTSRPIAKPESAPGPTTSSTTPCATAFARRQPALSGDAFHVLHEDVARRCAWRSAPTSATIPPVHNPVVSNQLPFPFNIRAEHAVVGHAVFQRRRVQAGSATNRRNGIAARSW